MKTISLLILTGLTVVFFFFRGTPSGQDPQVVTGFYSDSAKMVIDKKCYGCHSDKGKSQKAKDKLMWDSLPGLQKGKIVATLDDIIEVLDEDMMPPEEFLKKYPDAKLLPSEKDALKNWAISRSDSLLK
jgi:hypothetical protein